MVELRTTTLIWLSIASMHLGDDQILVEAATNLSGCLYEHLVFQLLQLCQ